jgi:hypothetical protein
MITPRFTITTSDRRLTVSLDALPDALRASLRGKLAALTATLLAQVHAAEPARTGRLRSLTHGFLSERPNSIRGGVTIDGAAGSAHNIAAAALEYGVKRPFVVRAHQARITQVFGHAQAPQTVLIRAHGRRVNIAARRFLRGPAAAIRPRAIAEIQAAIDDAVTRTNRS